jgi:hypothetical protein
MEEIIEKVKTEIEIYHQKNYWNLFPAGMVPAWVYTAVAENIVMPMQDEIDKLKFEKDAVH